MFSYWTVDRFQLHVENAEISYKWIMPTQMYAYRLLPTRANIVKYRGVYKTEALCGIVYKELFTKRLQISKIHTENLLFYYYLFI